MRQGTERGGHPDAIAALVLLATRDPVAPGNRGAKKEVIPIDETFDDEFLTEECGVPVSTTLTGRITHFTCPDRPVGLQELFTVNMTVVATAGDNQIRVRNVGADVVQLTPDGTLIVTTTGQVPFDFTGALKINLDTGEVILEPHRFVDIDQVCEQLTA